MTWEFLHARKTLRALRKGLVEWRRHCEVRTPQHAAHAMEDSFTNELQNVGRAFEAICEATARSESQARPLEETLN